MNAVVDMSPTVDPELIAWYREQAATGMQFQGLSLLPYAKSVNKLIIATGATRLLDYGCGLGYQYSRAKLHDFWRVPQPTLYDPAVAGLDTKPEGTFDGVICSDVLEHVPAELIGNVLRELFDYAEQFVWLSVCTRLAKKHFPDGRNLHVTCQPSSWWADRVRKFAKGRRYQLVFTP